MASPCFNRPHNKPLQTDERRVAVPAYCRLTLAPLAAERQNVRQAEKVIVLREYDIVRVAKLIEPARRFDGSEGARRPPQIGDVATICHVYDPKDPIAPVAVEMVDHEGRTLWLADFQRSELEFVERP